MATNLIFNLSTKKYQGATSPSATIYARVYDPAGNLILDKSASGNAFITASTTSALYNLPLDTSSNVLQGAYTFVYGTVAGMGTGTTTTVIYTYSGVSVTCQEFNVTNDCNFYPNGQITATDSTNYGDWTVTTKSIKLYFPNGLSPAPIAPYIETTTASTLVVNTLATGMWTAILTANLTITQVDGLTIVAVLTKTLNHNVACNSQLCSVNDALDQITSAYAADVACGSTTPRYAQELTLANAYYTQYQIERSCGDSLAASAYADKITSLLGQSHSSCGGSCGCSGSSCSCDTSCGCSGEDTTPTWVNNTSSESGCKSYVALMSQSGTNDPAVTILENSVGDIEWVYDGAGTYEGYSLNAFPAGKTFIRINLTDNISEIVTAYRYDNSYVYVTTGGTNGILNNNAFEIRVYN
jgi:hypothetical protein